MAFARFQQTRSTATPMAEINVTPLVDVMLVLLVIFMLAAPVMTTAIRLQLPQTTPVSAAAAQSDLIKISIDAQSRLYWQAQLLSEQELLSQFRDLQRKQQHPQIQLHIDRSVPYEVLARLMAMAQAHGQQQLVFVTAVQADKSN